jgi:formylglycine-generating enzyme required for sulfatase activity
MMTEMKRILIYIAVWLLATRLQAQVNIGSTEEPQPFSVLELFSNQQRGLRLPQLTTAQRDALQATFGAEITGKAMGLQIFNTKTKCVETWNGAAWIQECFNNTPALPPVSPFLPVACGVSTSNNLTYTCIADPKAEAYEWFVNGSSQEETTTNSITFATAQTNVTVSYLYLPAFLRPTMKDVAGNGGSATWYWGTGTPPGTATTVSISDFKMSETPVTQAQFSAVMGVSPYAFVCGGDRATHVDCRPTSALPAENINWYAAIAYCNKLSLLEGKTPVYAVAGVSDWANLAYSSIPAFSNNDPDWNAATCNFAANGYRLPTESEWEYAARGGTANAHPVFSGSAYTYTGSWSNTQEAKDSLNLVGWSSNHNGTSTVVCSSNITPWGTKPVKGKRANVFGLYDMSGNVNEWCWNWSNETFPMATPSGNVASVGSSSFRVVRGGHWNGASNYSLVSYRTNGTPDSPAFNLGFRVVMGTFGAG